MYFVSIVVSYVGKLNYENICAILENRLDKNIKRENKGNEVGTGRKTFLFKDISLEYSSKEFKHVDERTKKSQSLKKLILEDLRDNKTDDANVQVFHYDSNWFKHNAKLIAIVLGIIGAVGSIFTVLEYFNLKPDFLL